ncbi:hypothetical protein HOLleu_00643 [Holothuria leucospilota]|uniref:CCHC-type domain-containing protein n=1 Tax=Holothuria leucospilota TaxID=206669 RepID=A0A9Q1CMI0_HOLLE|nr:hypothetical protein HOLleu_00643 [Holothuria leucospilota]
MLPECRACLALKGLEGLTVTPYDRSVVVTVLVERRGTKPSRVLLDVAADTGRWGTTRPCPNEVRCNLCGEEGHVFGACPELYSAHASENVGQAPEPSQLGPEYSTQELEEVAHEVEQDFLASKQCEAGTVTPEADSPPSLPAEPKEAGIMTVEEDLHLSSDSESVSSMSDDGEPPPKDPPSGEGWFDLCEGEGSESALKRSASGAVSEWGDRHSERPVPSPRVKKIKPQQELLVSL